MDQMALCRLLVQQNQGHHDLQTNLLARMDQVNLQIQVDQEYPMYRLVQQALPVLLVPTDQADPTVLPIQLVRTDQLVRVVLEIQAVHLDLQGPGGPEHLVLQRPKSLGLRLIQVFPEYLHSLVGQCLQLALVVLLALMVLRVRYCRRDLRVLVSPDLQQALQALSHRLVPLVQRDLDCPPVRLVLGLLRGLEARRVPHHLAFHLVQPVPRGRKVLKVPGLPNLLQHLQNLMVRPVHWDLLVLEVLKDPENLDLLQVQKDPRALYPRDYRMDLSALKDLVVLCLQRDLRVLRVQKVLADQPDQEIL